MKKPTIFKTLIAVVFLLLSISSHAQLRKGFTSRYATSLNGDILVIGNNSLNRDNGSGERPLNPYNDQGSGSQVNDNFNMKYIDIDSETSFNSSSATLTIPQASKTCFEIVYAALYWSGTYQGSDRSKINQVRLKTPTTTTYKALTGSVLWDDGATGVTSPYGSLPYACFVDITADVKAAKEGVYTVADVMCSEGKFSPGGNSAGWSIFVVYKDPLLPSKYITSFDGFSIIRSSDPPLDIPISGFRTNPFGNVNVKLAFSALEGDNQLSGDGLQIIGGKAGSVWGPISSLVRPIAPGNPPKPNFFNSTITDGDVILGGRTPSSKNTLGYDAGVVTLDNNVGGVQNSVIQNDETNATLRINTSQDSYFMFFNALSVEIIEPKIVLKKNVLDKDDNNIGSQTVSLDQELRYEIKFKNEGNDNAKNFTITDVLPNNVIFNGLSDILIMDPRITATYNAATRTLVFTVPDNMVVSKGAEYTLKFKVRVVKDCNELVDACSNEIKNTAVSKYFGDKNTTPGGFGEGSYSTISSCNIGEPTSTNFLVGIDQCLFSRDVSLCGTAVLKAANGYSTYVWKDPNGVIFGGNNQSVTVDKPGTYTVDDSGAVNCKPILQKFVVTDYLASANKNPIKGDNIDPATGLAYGCVRDNKPFPKIFLCGLNDKRIIDTQITGATSITWQETKDVPPVGSPVPDSCPYEGATNWTTVATGPIFTADRPGVFRLVVNYGNNTCVVTYYFNVYQNLLDATAKKQDIICNTKGSITVTNPLPNTGYVYSLDGTNYQASNIFNNVAKGSYTVQIKQTVLEAGQVSACVFKVNVNVEQLDFTSDLVATHPLCNGEQGTIKATINNVPGQYKFILRKKGSVVEIQNSGLIDNNYITFNGVDPGIYEVLMSTANNGCSVIKEIEIFDYRLTAVAKVTKALTACGDGEITVTVTGGTPRPGPPPYYLYYVNGNTNPLTNPVIPVTRPLPASGEYNIVVVDANGCSVTIPPVKVTDLPKPIPTFTTVDVNCYGANNGVINMTVTPANSGFTVSYSINGAAFSSVSPITNLAPGNYSIIVKYTYGTIGCVDPAVNVTIGGPSAALTASGGVSELAGCDPSGNGFGKVRITNPQGGVAPYTYSFDGGNTWITSNEAYVAPGTYTLYIKDANGCTYPMSGIVLDTKPADPTIALDPTVYNCDGTGKTTATVTNSGGNNYTYEYYLDGNPNTPITNNVFNNITTGTHTVSVKYNLVSATTFSNLLQEDFGKGGYTTTPGISPKYCFEDETTPHPTGFPSICGNINDYQINDGKYAVASSIKTTFGGSWIVAKDHTTPADPLGRFLCVNIGSSAGVGGIIYSKPIKDVIVNQPVIISLWAENLMKSTSGSGFYDPELTIQLINNLNGVGGPETIVATTDTANPWKVPRDEKWEYKELSLNPGAYNNLSFVIRSYNNKFNGNDLLVDDIWVRQLPKSCISQKDFPVVIGSNKAFTASITGHKDVTCNGTSNGEITLAAQNFNLPYGFDYSIDNGGTWVNSKVSPVTVTGLTSKTYAIQIRFDNNATTCSFPFSQPIGTPAALTITAAVTKQATCTTGATITGTANGGTPAYSYELRASNGVTVLVPFQTSGTFTNVASGTYTVVTKDLNSCVSSASAVVNVVAPTAPTAVLAASSDLCYDTVNKATLVVTATGSGTLTYSLDGAAAQNSNTFTNVGTGTHSIVVTDSNNCQVTVSGIVIAPELTAVTATTKALDCTSSPNAQITVTPTGGTAPYTYEVSTNGGTSYTAMATNVYSAAAGTYQFRVTDSKGCIVVTTATTINAIVNPTVTATKVNSSCNGSSNGSVTLTGAGGSGGYTYSFNGSAFTATTTYTGLAAGTYSYQVKDSKQCLSATGSVTITQPSTLAATVAEVGFTCNASNGKVAGTVTVNVTAGTGTAPYEYSFNGSGYSSNNVLTLNDNGANQPYTYSVRDAGGCPVTGSGTLFKLNPPTDLTFANAAITCTATSTTVTVTAVNGVGTLQYETIAPSPIIRAKQTGTSFAGLTPGTYTFRVTDANGCYYTESYTINAVTPIAITGNKTSDVLCKGGSTGSVTFTVSGLATVGNYTSSLTAGTGTLVKSGNTLTLSNVAAGTYTVQVTDNATGCVNSATVVVNEPTNALTFTQVATNVNCNNDNAQITVTASGGTASYSYAAVIAGPTAPTVYDSSNVITVDTNSGGNLTWDVYVKDANGCITKNSIAIVGDALPSVTSVTVNNQCTASGSGFTFTAVGSGLAPLTYSINGGAFQPSGTFTVAAGTYTVTVKDKNGCTATAPVSTIVYGQLTTVAAVTKELDCSASPNAVITVTISGGKGQYTYTVKKGSGAASAPSAPIAGPTFTIPVTLANADSYTFVITDANGCTSTTNATVVPIANPTVTATQVNVTCNAAANGSVTLTGAGGSGGYTYSNNAVTGFTPTATFSGLAAGTYSFYVKDSKGCVGTISVTITQPSTLAATVAEVGFTCNASNGKVAGTVTVNVTAGTGTAPYEYSFNGSGYSSNNVLTLNDNGANQPYTYSVRDAGGCPVTGSGTLFKLNPPTDLTFANAAITCTATSTTVTVTAVNGVGTLQYETIAPSPIIRAKQTGTSFAGLTPGTYTFRVTDANGCYYTESYTINAVTPIAITGNKTSDVLCKGGSTGSVTFTVSGLATVGNYTSSLTAGTGTLVKSGNTLTLSNVAAGTYTVQVTDNATGCVNSATVVVNEPTNALTFTQVATNVNCNNDNAQITVTASGGTASYSYAAVIAGPTAPTVYDSSNVITVDTNSGGNLTWDVYVKDANGCITKNSIAIVGDALPSVTSVTVNNQCTASGSGFTFTAVGSGLAPLTYSINGGAFQPSGTFTVAAGTYTVTVKDKNGCTATAPVSTIVYGQLTTVAAVTKELDCSASPNAVITVTISGGKGQYTYTVKKGSGAASAPSAPIAGPTFTIPVTLANADSYTFVITDANGCTSTTNATVVPIANPTVTATQVNVTCNAAANGSVTLTGAGGSGGYTYSNNAVTGFTPTATFSGLAAGTYSFYVKDSKGCVGTISVTITQPSTLAATVAEVGFTCNASNGKVAGTVTVNVTAGTGTAPYEYSFNGSGYSSNNVLTLNDNGANQPYTYSVRDAGGCPVTGSGTLFKLNPPTDLTFANAAITCTATSTTVTVTAVNGVGTLQYETIAPSPIIRAKQTGTSFAGLTPGTYTFRVTDANGCYYTESYTINAVTPITVLGSKLSDVLCNGGNTGTVKYTVSGFAGTYSYSINGAAAITLQSSSTINLPNQVAGTYAIVVTDEVTGCSANASVTINQPAAALNATYTAVNANCGVSTSAVTVTVTGGTPSYRYSFVQDGLPAGTYTNTNTANLNPTTNANWDVHIIDANGCTFKLDISIVKDTAPTVSASATGQCFGVGTYTITATGTGKAPLQYSINNGASYQAGNTFAVSTPGTYTITVKDGNGCTATSNAVIVYPKLTLTATLDKDNTCSVPQAAQITLTATNGNNASYTYESSNDSGATYTAMASNVFNTTVAGTYTFRVTDANGCQAVTTTAITTTAVVLPVITSVTQTQSINCNGDNTAAISIVNNTSLGLAPFVFNVYNNTTFHDYVTQTSGLAAGNYTITVTDAKGCQDTKTITINQPAAINFALTKVDITCNNPGGTSLGSITVQGVTGGTAPFKYFITNNFGDVIAGNPYVAVTNENHTFNIINFGIYTINVIDANGCSLSKQITMASPPSDLSIDITTVAPDCTNGGTAVVKVISIVGSGNYEFGILETNTAPYTSTYYPADPGTPDTKIFDHLTPGVTYTFVVHDLTTLCYYVKSASPILPASPLKVVAVAKNVTCKNANNGSVTFTVSNFDSTTNSVDYQIFKAFSNAPVGVLVNVPVTFGTPVTITYPSPGPGNLLPGSYYIKIIEHGTSSYNNCESASAIFEIKESAIALSLTASVIKNANCANNSGVITAVAKDGTAPYTYQLLLSSDPAPTEASAGWASANTFNANAGNYIVYTKDDYGCIKQFSVALTKDADPIVTAPATICYDGNPFTIVIGGTVSVGPATYSVNTGAYQAGSSFTFNAPGIYNLNIKDGNGCIATIPYEVKPQLQINAQITKELDCTVTPNATITLTASGGYNTAYTYEYSLNGGSFITMASNVYSTSAIGNYIFKVKDAKLPVACEATTTLTLDPIPAITFGTTVTNVTCNGGNNGAITVNVTGGVGPFQYKLDGGPFQTLNEFTGLTAGTSYQITVKDAKSCTLTGSAITIAEPGPLTATSIITTALTCGSGNTPSKAVVTVTGVAGTAPYKYSFDNGVTYTSTNTYETYAGITFNVLVKDANGCLFTFTNGVNVPALNPPTDLNFTSTPVTCTTTTSTVTLTATNGVGPLGYAILSPASAVSNVSGATSGIFTTLAPDTYVFEVTDANGCKYQESYTVTPVTNITVAGQLISDVSCNGGSDGAVRFTVGNFAGTYNYSINGAPAIVAQNAAIINLTGLAIGTQTIVVTDEVTGCAATIAVTVAQPTVLGLTVASNVNANCNFGAKVAVTATGGTPNYVYAFVQDAVVPTATDYTNSASAVLDPTVNTQWDVYVKDARGCINKKDVTIATDALPTINSSAGLYCYTGGSVPITITGTYVGTPTYSIGNGYFASPNFVLNAPGNYTFYIKDGNGCIVSSPYTLRQELLLQASLTQDLTCAGSATITLLATQGTNTYGGFEVDFNNSGTYVPATSPYTATAPGTYTFRVADSQGCQAVSIPVVVTPKTVPTATFVQNNVSCVGGNDGSIVITAANGIAPYQYSNDNGVTFKSSNVFTGLTAGTYNIVVKDSKSCTSVAMTVTITQPSAIAATAVLTQGLTCGAGNATQPALVTVNVTAGTGTAPYQYSFNAGVSYSSTNTYSTYASGTVTAYVKDSKGCVIAIPVSVMIPALNKPTDLNFTSTAVTCTTTTSTVTLTATNGVGPLGYAILSPASAVSNVSGATSGIFTTLAPDTYVFEVTDANGCKYQESYTVTPVTNITVAGQLISDVSCNGGSDGAVRFTVGNFAGTYRYLINGAPAIVAQNAAIINLTGLAIGTQTIVVTDEVTGCAATIAVTVAQPTVLGLTVASNVNANCNFGAKVAVTATGGTPNYVYAFVQDAVVPTATDYTNSASAVLDPTVNTQWDVYVKDARGCINKKDVTIATDALPTINSSAGLYCYTGGSVPITITGTYVGTPTYSIGNGYFASPNFVLNAPGNYTFYIKDGNGCIVSSPYTLRQELLLQASLTQDLTCAGSATITLLATQGTNTYGGFEVDFNNSGTYVPATSPYTATAPGTYTFRVADSQGCQAVSIPVVVTPKTVPTATFVQNNVSCVGGNDGSIVITAANGIAPYQYSNDNGVTFKSSNVFTGLTAGTYNIVVKDSKSCTSVAMTVTITQPSAIAATAVLTQGLTCGAGNATQPALVTVNVTAGTGTAPYQYSFNAGVSYSSTNTYSTYTSGTVTAYVKDSKGCVIAVPVSVMIPALNKPTDLNFTSTPVTCTTTTSTVTLTATNGVGPLGYAILSPASAVSNVSGATSGIFTTLAPDTYVFEVTDANGCKYQESYTVTPVTNITVAGQLISDVSCNGGSDGAVRFTVGNFAGTYRYSINGAPAIVAQNAAIINLTGLAIGTQTIVVTDEVTGCAATIAVTVAQPTVLGLTVASNVNANCNFGAKVAVTATGGTPNYVYAFVQDAVVPTATDYTNSASAVLDPTVNTQWDVYVKDARGCINKKDVTIATDALPTGVTANVVSQCASLTGDYTFTVNVTSGIAPYEYSIGNGFQSSNSFTVKAPGSYDITVRDANGCTTTVMAAAIISPTLDLKATVTALPSCDFNDGIIDASAIGGSASTNYRYTLDGGVIVNAATAHFTGVAPGTHIVQVRDALTGCTDSVTVTLGSATVITGFNLNATNVSCKGFSDGQIIVNIDANAPGVNDNPIYTYKLTGTAIDGTSVTVGPQQQNVFSNLKAGDYTVMVISGRGCKAQEDVRIIEPALIVVNAPVVSGFNCTAGTNATNYATITVNSVTGGSLHYVVYEFSKAGVVVQTGSSNVYTEANTLGGSYTVKVIDDKGCEGFSTTPIVIAPFITMDDMAVTVNTPITCISNEDITVTVATTGGVPALLNYNVSGFGTTVYNVSNTTGIFTGLAIGNYIITISNPTTGCSIQKPYYISDPNTFAINVQPVKGKVCYGDADGSVNLTFVDNQLIPTNDAGPFSYVITGPVPSSGTTTSAGPILISGLKAGTYTVKATLVNSPFCPVPYTFTIEQATAPLAVTKTQSDITCLAGNKDGAIIASATGGWPGDYLYELRLGTTIVKAYNSSPKFDNLTAGDYTVFVKDGLGCEAFVNAKLTNPAPIKIQISATPMLTCFDNENGVVTINSITGGSGNYTYTLNGVLADGTVTVEESQGTNQFTGLKAGTYTITAKDTWSCSGVSNTVVIDQPTKVKAELTIARNETCQLVPILKITATGGKAPYYYSADGTNYSASFNSTVDVTLPRTTADKAYKYFVKDASGCISTVSNTVEVPVIPKLSFVSVVDVDIKCKGSSEGTITAVATGGLGNYVFTLQNAAGVNITPAPTQLTPGVFTQLPLGTYIVKLASSDCSETSAVIEISEPNVALSAEAIPTAVSCNGFNNGKIVVNAKGGTGVYKYAIEPEFRQFFDKNIFENLKPGFYDVLVQDENECYIFIKDVHVKEPDPLNGALVDGTLLPEICAGEKNGSFSIILSGGTADYSVSLDSETGPFTKGTAGQTTFDFKNLSGGPHIVYFVDAQGCDNKVDIAMDKAVTLNPTNEVNYDCVNNAASNMVTVDPGYDGDHSELDYRLDGGQPQMNNIFTGLTPGNHKIRVTHTNGCYADTSFIIKVVDPLVLTLSEEKGVWNVITATATGGSKDYEYSIDGINFSSENKFTIYKTDTYTITVRDKNGCTDKKSIYIKYVDVCMPNYFTPNGTYYTGWGPGCTNIYTNLVFSIFDRYGREIAKYHYGQKWDGKYNGEELPSGDYWYVLKLNDEKDAREFVGHFTLYR
ncbi:T9SS type B sorting domain-containing protein [uncultured Flavobacterium sp.]|uniref:T9SS type B sorting domain-containing protein n=1 Tax=uncultured Flavobacterium sp. TaxID=165435 RepID=UPI00292E6BC3|nr:T9SS type B sorting domain-containing protein [uncultured Flavobacterium sp.]